MANTTQFEVPKIMEAPWSPDQIKALMDWQLEGVGHPYTCENRGDESHRFIGTDKGMLIATKEGFICPFCSYTQNWAYEIDQVVIDEHKKSRKLLKDRMKV